MKLLFVVVITILLSACATKPVQIAYNCPTLMLPPDPVPFTRSLTGKSPPDEVVKAWVATAIAYRDWDRVVRLQVSKS